jgi:tetratricopeptide (TPR) repeat protein
VKDRPVALLLHDQQNFLEPGKISTFSELAFKIQKPEGLAAGNLSIAWNPAFDTVTVNRLEIRRGNQVIDVLKSGQTFTTMRRESNLEAAMLDGMLTANIQPEGLQEGDVVVLATTTEHVDPTLKDHVETVFAPWGDAQIGLAHTRISWPSNVDVKLQKTGDLPAPVQNGSNGRKSYELTMHDVEPVIAPKGAPLRFKIGRMGEATDFRSWAEAARLMAPLYREAAVIAASGPLRDEVEKIRKASTDPKVRAEQALQLVQQRIRYLALAMGQGGLVPAKAEATWSRRFGDCKAKTALLLAILHEYGISAEPVLANVFAGDAVGEWLPMIGAFNHVLVRAHIDGKEYWLDGTRSGDTDIDGIEVPDFGWGLPLVDNAQLVRMVPAPRSIPTAERRVDVDASAGLFAPAPVMIEEIYRGDSAVEMNTRYSALSSDQRDEQMRTRARGYFDGFAAVSSSLQFDSTKRVLDLKIQGKAQLSWKDGWFDVPTSSVGFDPDFDRPAGPLHDVPVEVNHPRFVKDLSSIKLPGGMTLQQKLSPAIHETLAGVEYTRTEAVSGDVLTVESSERSIAPEVPYRDALTAEQRLRAMSKDDVYLKMPEKYQATDADLAALNGQMPQSPLDHLIRAQARLAHGQTDNALDDLNAALALEPKNLVALMMRATVYGQQHKALEAEKDIAAGLAIEPNNSNLLAFRGAFLMTQAKNDAAKQSFIRALEIDPNNVEARLQLGWLLSAQNDSDGAMREFNTLITRDAGNVRALAARALVNAFKHDYAAAKTDIAAAEAIDPNNIAVKTTKATIAGQQNDYAGEVEIFSGLIAQDPKTGGNYFNRAGAYSALGKDDLALKDVDEAIALGFKDTPVRVLRANIMMRRGNHEAVAQEADLMLQETANSSWALVAAAKTYAAIGQRDKAMQAFDRALAIKPEAYIYVNRAQVRPSSDVSGRLADLDQALKLEANMPDALSIKASILSNQGKYSEALALYDQMPKSGANDMWVETQRAVLLSKSGRSSEAVNAFASLRSKAKSPVDLNSLCWAEGTAGVALDYAVNECSEAVKLSDRNPQYVDSLGMALLKSGKLDEALTVYTEAINKGHLSASYMGRAIIYARKGDRARAQADLAEAKKLEPTIDDRFAEYGLQLDGKVAPSDSDDRAVTKH